MAAIEMSFEDLKNRSHEDLLGKYTQDYLETLIGDAEDLVHTTCPTVEARQVAVSIALLWCLGPRGFPAWRIRREPR